MKVFRLIPWLVVLFLFPNWGQSQNCGCQDCGIDIPALSNNTHDFIINDLVNADLSSPTQGICGVELHFEHRRIRGLEMTLTSPAGQQIRLIGTNLPTPTINTTINANWDIKFVRGIDPASPDPAKSNTWLNGDGWVNGGKYTGTYHPNNGNLEDFNMGSANGVWQLNIQNYEFFANYWGRLLGFRLIFCDPTGISCCFAEAGEITAPTELEFCENDPNLLITPNHQYNEPDTLIHDFRWLIGQDTVILKYDTIVDLRAYAPGVYEICGLSYLKMDLDSLPIPDGIARWDDLKDSIELAEPKFCADISDQCLQVTIHAPPAPTNVIDSFCIGTNFLKGDSIFSKAGIHNVVFKLPTGCDSLVVLDLREILPDTTYLTETICVNTTFAVGSSIYGSSGIYLDTFPTTQLCDSIVKLNLTVLPAIDTTLNLLICKGDTIDISGQKLFDKGNYQIMTTAKRANCDSLINVNLSVLEPTAQIDNPDLITCSSPRILLVGSNSSPSSRIDFNWTTSDGIITSTNFLSSVFVSDSGNYQLIVKQDSLGLTCSDTSVVKVEMDKTLPIVMLQSVDTLNCEVMEVAITSNGSSAGDFSYLWKQNGGGVIAGQTSNQLNVSDPGFYELVLSNNQTGCKDSTQIRVIRDVTPPVSEAGIGFELNCTKHSDELDGTGSSPENYMTYQWSGPGLNCCDQTLQPTVNQEGRYYLDVLNTRNKCSAIDSVNVTIDENLPTANVGLDQEINCRDSVIEIRGNGTSAPGIQNSWSSYTGNDFVILNPITIEARTPGAYVFTVFNQDNNCEKRDTILVTENTQKPTADAGRDTTLTCAVTLVELSGAGTDVGSDFLHIWFKNNIPQLGGNDPTLVVTEPGNFSLQVINGSNFCRDTSYVSVTQDTIPPKVEAGSDFELNCVDDTYRLVGSTDLMSNFDLEWKTDTGQIVQDANTLSPLVNADGYYFLTIKNNENQCEAVDSVFIQQDENLPSAFVLKDTLYLECDNYEVILDGTGSTQRDSIGYQWSLNSDSIGNTMQTLVFEAGNYLLEVIDSTNNCIASNNVFVVDTISPIIILSHPLEMDCDDINNGFVLDASGSTQGDRFLYDWMTINGQFVSRTDTLTPVINSPGLYNLVIRDTLNNCAQEVDVSVTIVAGLPIAEAGNNLVVPCGVDSILIDGSASSNDAGVNFLWTTSDGAILSNPTQNSIFADTSGLYFLEVTNTLNNCTVIDSVEVFFQPCAPSILILANDTINCDQTEVRLDASMSNLFNARLDWTAINGQIIADSDTPFPLVTAGIYELRLTDTINNISDNFQVIVPIDTIRPEADAGPDKILTCRNRTAILEGSVENTANQFEYSWTGPGLINTPDILQPTVESDGTFEFILRNLKNGCKDTSYVNVTFDTLAPRADAGMNLTFPCDPDSLQLDGSGSDFGIGYAIQWNFGSTDLRPYIRQPGTYCIEVENLTNGCKSDSCVVVIPDDNAPVIAVGDDEIFNCKDTLFELSVQLPLGNLEYYWESFDGCFETDSTLQNVDVSCIGEYTIVVKNLDNQCISSETIQVIDATNFPKADAGLNQNLTCKDTLLPLDGSNSDFGINYLYEWSGPGIVSGTNTLAPEVNLIGEYILEVMDTSTGCFSLDTMNIGEQITPPTANAGIDLELTCRADTIQLNGTLSSLTNDYQWTTIGGRFVSGVTTLEPEIDRPGAYILEVLNPVNGCSETDTIVVGSIDELPEIEFDLSTDFMINCYNETIELNAQSSKPAGGLNFRWSTFQGNITTNTIAQNVEVDKGGWYFLNVERTDNGCEKVDSIFVDFNKVIPPISTLEPDKLTCDTLEIALESIVPDTILNYNVTWSTIDGNFIESIDTLKTRVNRAGRYIVSIIDLENGCTNETSTLVEIDTIPPVAVAEVAAFLDCFKTSVVLDGTGSSRDSTFFIYEWTTNNGGNIINENNLNPTVDAEGIYSIMVKDTRTGCINFDSVLVAQEAAGIQSFELELEPITCVGMNNASIQIDSILGGTPPFMFSINGSPFGGFGQFSNLEAGAYDIKIQDAAGCESDTSVVFDNGLDLLIDLGPDLTIRVGDSVDLEALISIPFSQIGEINWTHGLDSICDMCLNQVVSPFITTEYIVMAADTNGCTTSDDILINVTRERPIYIPSAFSPNGDGNNDVFMIYGVNSSVDIQSFQIYDRWGNIVHSKKNVEANNPKFGWDGTFKGKDMNGGVFVYMAKIEFPDGKVEVFEGDLTLYR